MAGDWIKIEHAMPDKPEVIRMTDALGIDQDAVSGKLLRLWIWADQQIESDAGSDAVSVTEAFVDRLTFCSGFAQALCNVGWMDVEGESLSIPNFEKHNGQSAKKRAKTARRNSSYRKRSANRDAPTVTEASQNASPREEKSVFLKKHTKARAKIPKSQTWTQGLTG